MLVTIWNKEKERTFSDDRIKKAQEEELDNILNVEQANQESWDNDDQWDLPDGFEMINQQGEDVQKLEQKRADVNHNVNVVPTADDPDQTIDEYIDKVYPNYPKYNAYES